MKKIPTFQCGRYDIFKKKFFALENIKNALKSNMLYDPVQKFQAQKQPKSHFLFHKNGILRYTAWIWI